MKTRRVHKGRKTRRHTNKRHSRHTNKRPGGRHTNKRPGGRRHTNKRKSTKGGGKNTIFNHQANYSDALYIGEQNLSEVDPKAQAKYNEKMNRKCPKLDCDIHKQLLDKKFMRENIKSIQRYLNAKLPFYKKLSEQDIIKCIFFFQTKCIAKADACVNIGYTQFDENLSDDEVNELMETLKTKYNLSQNELEKCITDNQFKKANIKNDPYALVRVSNESMFNEDKKKKGNKKKSSGSQYGFDATSLNSDASLFNPKDPNYKFEIERRSGPDFTVVDE